MPVPSPKPKRGYTPGIGNAHLRELLTADHRYVFTLIHKFQPSTRKRARREMPVLVGPRQTSS